MLPVLLAAGEGSAVLAGGSEIRSSSLPLPSLSLQCGEPMRGFRVHTVITCVGTGGVSTQLSHPKQQVVSWGVAGRGML